MATRLSTLECLFMTGHSQFVHDWSFTGVVECRMCFDLSVLSKRVHDAQYHICTCGVCWF